MFPLKRLIGYRNIGLYSIAPPVIIALRTYSLLKANAKSKGKIIAPICVLLLFANASKSVKERQLAAAIVGRAITIWEAIQNRSPEPINKTHTKIEGKRLKATTFAITKLEER